jgi:hypothetical protein
MNLDFISNIQFVTSGVSLAGFIAALVFYGYRGRLDHELNLVKAVAIEDRPAVIDVIADRFSIQVDSLTTQQKFQIVVKQIEAKRRRQSMIFVSALTLALIFLALTIVSAVSG